MRVGILGSGLMGGKLGTIFARVGHEVRGVGCPNHGIWKE
jgi:prephenate dehydrogenase